MNDAPKPVALSKSKFTAAYRCLKKLYLSVHQPESAYKSAQAMLAIQAGDDVGEMAKQIYRNDKSVEVELQRDRQAMVRETAALLEQGADFPIFEATFEHEGVLVRVDVLLPDGDGWRVIEIKGSAEKKPEHEIDCAIQWWVLRGAGLPVTSIAVGHVSSEFVYAGNNDYRGLITEVDVTERVEELQEEVIEYLPKARDAAAGTIPDVAVGMQCRNPQDCEFFKVCWPVDGDYPVHKLGGSKANQAMWVNRGITDLREVPADEITGKDPQRVHRITCAGEPELLAAAREELASKAYPWYHLDFETIAPAVPRWKGTRPYMKLAVQYSIHKDDGSGDGSFKNMDHDEFLLISEEAPMRALAERMIKYLGDSGTVFMYSTYEKQVIDKLIELYPDLRPQLQAIIDRLVDLQKIVKKNYYHPSMLGSWSVKAAAPAMAPDMNYETLEGIKNGAQAVGGYLEAIDPNTSAERKAKLKKQLLRYCRFDTEAMVEIARVLSLPN